MNAMPSDQDSPPPAGIAPLAGWTAPLAVDAKRIAGEEHAVTETMLREMHGMARLLAESRAEIIGLTPTINGDQPLQDAGDMLDVVVAETERATFEIMNQAEHAQATVVRLQAIATPEIAAGLAEVNEAATAIVLACIFQDITGQRIRKVMSTLREIERRVSTLITLMGISAAEAVPAPVAPQLLNGPSSAAEGGLGQGAVDDLFT